MASTKWWVVITPQLEQRDDYGEATRYANARKPLVDLLKKGHADIFDDGYVVPRASDTRARNPHEWENLLLCGSLVDGSTDDARFIDGLRTSRDLDFALVSDQECECETLCYWFDEVHERERVETRCTKNAEKRCSIGHELCHHTGPHYHGAEGEKVPTSVLAPLQDLHSLLKSSRTLQGIGSEGENPQVTVPILRLSSFLDLLRVCAFWKKYGSLREDVSRELDSLAKGSAVAAG